MPKATHTDTTTAPAPALAPVAPTASIDASLLALAAEFQQVDARLMAINDEIMVDTTDTLSMDKGKPAAVHDRWWAIVNRVIELPAYTVPGWGAKAGHDSAGDPRRVEHGHRHGGHQPRPVAGA
jgi:hypothetical protein